MKLLGIIAVGMAFAAGCNEGSNSQSVDCGDADYVASEGQAYCFYSGALIIHGFQCPSEHAFEQRFADGSIACADSEMESEQANNAHGQWQEQFPDRSRCEEATNMCHNCETNKEVFALCLDSQWRCPTGTQSEQCLNELECVGDAPMCSDCFGDGAPVAANCTAGSWVCPPAHATSCPAPADSECTAHSDCDSGFCNYGHCATACDPDEEPSVDHPCYQDGVSHYCSPSLSEPLSNKGFCGPYQMLGIEKGYETTTMSGGYPTRETFYVGVLEVVSRQRRLIQLSNDRFRLEWSANWRGLSDIAFTLDLPLYPEQVGDVVVRDSYINNENINGTVDISCNCSGLECPCSGWNNTATIFFWASMSKRNATDIGFFVDARISVNEGEHIFHIRDYVLLDMSENTCFYDSDCSQGVCGGSWSYDMFYDLFGQIGFCTSECQSSDDCEDDWMCMDRPTQELPGFRNVCLPL